MKVVVHVEGPTDLSSITSLDFHRVIDSLRAIGILDMATRVGIELVDEPAPETKP